MARIARKPAAQPDNIVNLKAAARGRWAEILSAVGGCDGDLLDGQHHPCPKCGGTDRFRFTDQAGDGSVICNQCARRHCGDGLATVGWLTGWTFPEVVRRVSDHLGIDSSNGNHNGKKNGKPAADPGKDLATITWSDAIAALWCTSKPPIVSTSILTAGGRLAKYRGRYVVIDVPVIGKSGRPVGHVIVNASGGQLPKVAKQADGTYKITEWVGKKLTYGSEPGWIGTTDRLPDASIVWWVEGLTDLLAVLSLPDLPANVAVVTNAMGCGEKPQPWMLQALAGKTVNVVGDADKPGQEGAQMKATAAAYLADAVRLVKLPFPVSDTHGKDVRDWITGRTYADLLTLASSGEAIAKTAGDPDDFSGLQVLEADDDPDRLARVNLERYAAITGGRTLKCWRSEWYTWKGRKYSKISREELQAKVHRTIKAEFNRLNIEALERFNNGIRAGLIDENEKPPKAHKVTSHLLTNVMGSMASMVTVPESLEFGTWLPTKQKMDYVALENGILDLNAVLDGGTIERCLLPNSPDWWSIASLPYAFDPLADCPVFKRTITHNLEGDEDRILLCQQWSGYLLTANTNQQKFMFLEGEGSNGKSVFLAALQAMIGQENCSYVGLELFGEPFMLTETLGKLLNVATECSEMDIVSEGHLKGLADGSPMTFNRKNKQPVSARATARLMLSGNVRPKFADKSNALWRRMILVPWRVQISERERITGMDKPEWWIASGELPGILNWAIAGLASLQKNGCFVKPKVCEEAMADYRLEVNPARRFIEDHYKVDRDDQYVKVHELYDAYEEWAHSNGYRPMSDGSLGREVLRCFPKSKRERIRDRCDTSKRYYVYWGISKSSGLDDIGVGSQPSYQGDEANQQQEIAF